MAKVGTAEYDVEINRAKVQAEVNAASRQIEAGLGGSARKVESEFASMAKAAVAGFAAYKGSQLVGDAIQAASDLEQSVGATQTVFGDASAAIDDYAKGSVEAFGLSERAFRESVAPTGAMLQALGYTEDQAAKTAVSLTGLAADFAAAFGGSTTDSIGAVNAAIRGEFDTIERYGVKLSAANVERKAMEMGLASTKSQLTDNAKAQATLALITEQGAKVQGQFARESDTLAVKQQKASAEFENSKAALGEALLPAAAATVEVFSDLAKVAGALPTPVLAAGLAVGGLVTAVGLLAPVLRTGWAEMGRLTASTTSATVASGGMTAATTAQAAAVQGLTVKLGALSIAQKGALAGFGAVDAWANKKANEDNHTSDQVVDEWIKQAKAGKVAAKDVQAAMSDLSDEAELSLFTAIGEKSPHALRLMRDALGEAYDATSPLGEALEDTARSQEKLSTATSLTTEELAEQVTQTRKVFDASRGVVGAQGDLLLAFDDYRKAQADAVTGGAEYAKALEAIAEARESAADAAEAVVDAERGLAEAQRNTKRAQDDLNEARKVAAERLEDLALAASGAAVDESGAKVALERAKSDALKAKTSLDRLEAQQKIAEAEQALREATDKRGDTAGELAEANEPGYVDPAVLDAQERVAESYRAQETASERVQDALRSQREAESRVAEATADAALVMQAAKDRVGEAAKRLEQAVLDEAEAQADLAEVTGGASAAQDAFRESLRRSAIALDPESPMRKNLTSFIRDLKELDDLEYPTSGYGISGTIGAVPEPQRTWGWNGGQTLIQNFNVNGVTDEKVLAEKAGRAASDNAMWGGGD